MFTLQKFPHIRASTDIHTHACFILRVHVYARVYKYPNPKP